MRILEIGWLDRVAIRITVIGVAAFLILSCNKFSAEGFCKSVSEGDAIVKVVSAAHSQDLIVEEKEEYLVVVHGWNVNAGQCLILHDGVVVVEHEYTNL